jgi:hypothetical protein
MVPMQTRYWPVSSSRITFYAYEFIDAPKRRPKLYCRCCAHKRIASNKHLDEARKAIESTWGEVKTGFMEGSSELEDGFQQTPVGERYNRALRRTNNPTSKRIERKFSAYYQKERTYEPIDTNYRLG